MQAWCVEERGSWVGERLICIKCVFTQGECVLREKVTHLSALFGYTIKGNTHKRFNWTLLLFIVDECEKNKQT